MNYSSLSTQKKLLQKIAGKTEKFQFRIISFIAILLFILTISARTTQTRFNRKRVDHGPSPSAVQYEPVIHHKTNPGPALTDTTQPVLINPAVGCSSLNTVTTGECFSTAANFNPNTLASAVAALYQDDSPPVTAIYQSTTAGQANNHCSWTFTYTFKIEDIFGNFVTCCVTRSGNDASLPAFTVPADITFYQNASCDLFDSPDTATAGNVTDATDNCGVLTVLYADCEGRRGTTAGCSNDCPGTKVIERTWRVFDSCGNMTEKVQLITIMDTISPVFTIFPQNFTTNGGDNVIYNVEATDNCLESYLTYRLSGATIDTGDGSGSGVHFNEGVTLVTITARDGCGNLKQNSFTVTVNDIVPPVIFAPNIFRSYSADNFGCSINLGASATDNTQLVSLTSDAPPCFPVGITAVTWTATDQHANVSTLVQLVTRVPPDIGITINAGITRTIYRGTTQGVGPFGPQSINLTSMVTGGLPPYSYSWSPADGLSNPNIANPVANPATTTTYTLTVTDYFGTNCNLSITINVLPLSAAICTGNGNNVKFNVCHIPPGNPTNPNNICISASSLPAHLTSGTQGHSNCYLGLCSQNTVSTTPGACQAPFNGRGINTGAGENRGEFIVKVSPNPSSGDFLIQAFSKSKEPVTVRIIDNNGALRSVSTSASGTNYVIIGSKMSGGIYMAEVIQGNNRQVVKLVKQH